MTPPAPGIDDGPAARSGPPAGWALLVTVPLSALAVLLVAIAFAGGRDGDVGTGRAFWVGQVLLIATAAVAAVAPRLDRASRYGTLVAFTIGQFAIKWAYTPVRFRFADELQHWQTLLNMEATGRLFPANLSLPISPGFPGLEAATITVMRVTGLGFFPSAMLVCGASTVLLTAAVLVLVSRFTDRADLVAIATLVYLANPNHGFFTSMYLYATPALPLLGLLLVAVHDLVRDRGPALRNRRLALLFGVALLLTHHVTHLIALAALAAIAIGCAVRPASRARAGSVGILLGQLVLLTVVWVGWFAPSTVNYLEQPVQDVWAMVTSVVPDTTKVPDSAAARPVAETAVSAVAILVVGATFGLLALRALHLRRLRSATVLLAVAASSVVVLPARLVNEDGVELIGRSFPYTALLQGVVFASVGTALVASVDAWRRAGTVLAAGALVVVGIGGVTTGIPAHWQRIPGTYHPAGFESAVDVHAMDVAWWARANVEPGTRFASDFGSQQTVGTLGGLDPVSGAAPLFYRDDWHERDRDWVQDLSVRLLVVDRRLPTEPAVIGAYFAGDVPGIDRELVDQTVAFPQAGIDTFARMTDLGILYDDGTVRIYDLQGSRYAF